MAGRSLIATSYCWVAKHVSTRTILAPHILAPTTYQLTGNLSNIFRCGGSPTCLGHGADLAHAEISQQDFLNGALTHGMAYFMSRWAIKMTYPSFISDFSHGRHQVPYNTRGYADVGGSC